MASKHGISYWLITLVQYSRWFAVFSQRRNIIAADMV
jgi:hypothetical protein